MSPEAVDSRQRPWKRIPHCEGEGVGVLPVARTLSLPLPLPLPSPLSSLLPSPDHGLIVIRQRHDPSSYPDNDTTFALQLPSTRMLRLLRSRWRMGGLC